MTNLLATMMLFFLALSLSTLGAEKGVNEADFNQQRAFLADVLNCPQKPNSINCRRIGTAKSESDLLAISNSALMLSEEEEKNFRNRISTLECCLAIGESTSCEGLSRARKDEACSCRKRLGLNGNGLNCKK